MRTFLAYCGLLVIVVLIVVGLSKLRRPYPPPPRSRPYDIHINGCQTIDEPHGHQHESIDFYPDQTYHVKFSQAISPTSGAQYPVIPSEFDISPASPTTAPAQHQLVGPNDCDRKLGCYYKYSLTRITNGTPEPTPCIDPGIHIIP